MDLTATKILTSLAIILRIYFPENAFSMPLKVWLNGKGKKPYSIDAPYNAAAPFQSAVFGHLLFINESLELRPGLLRSWRWDFKESCYYLTLKNDIHFHNGRIADSRDLEFSLLRGFYSKLPTFYSAILGNILGVDKITPGTEFVSGAVIGLKVIDDHTVRIKLSAPNPSFLNNLSYPYFSLVPIEALNKDYFTWKKLPIGTGPYQVVSSSSTSSSTLIKSVDAANTTAPRSVEIVTDGPPEAADLILWGNKLLSDEKFIKITASVASSATILLFNFNNKLGKDLDFRKFIYAQFDREQIAERNPELTPLYELLPRHFWGRININKDSSKFDTLLNFNSVIKKYPVLLAHNPLPIRTSELNDELVKKITNQVNKNGLKFGADLDYKKFWTKNDENTIMSVMSITMPDVDPLLEFTVFRSISPFKPFVPFNDQEFEKLYRSAAESSSLENRIDTVKALSTYAHKNVLFVPLFEKKPILYYNKEKIETIGQQDAGLSFFIANLKLKKKINE